MAAPKGNQFWRNAKNPGRPVKFPTPDHLWKAACEYFEWQDQNPLIEEKIFGYQGRIYKGTINKMRAYTQSSMCVFIGIGDSTFSDYSQNNEFSAVVENIKRIIYGQKFEGAAADLFNANIIARDLGLSDKSDVTSCGKPLKMVFSAPDTPK